MPDNIKGLIFDCDGTLVDSMPLHMKAWEHAITTTGAVWNYDFFFSKKGMLDADIVKLYNKHYSTSLNYAAIMQLKYGFFRAHNSDIKPVPHVVDVVKRYYKVLPMAVASGGTSEDVHFQLDLLGIKKLFDIILTADDKIKPKPAPDIFLEAAKRINVLPRFCQVFEDGDIGLRAAQIAGMQTVDIRCVNYV